MEAGNGVHGSLSDCIVVLGTFLTFSLPTPTGSAHHIIVFTYSSNNPVGEDEDSIVLSISTSEDEAIVDSVETSLFPFYPMYNRLPGTRGRVSARVNI